MQKDRFLKSIWVASLVVFIVFFSIAPLFAKEKLVVMTWGGNYADSLKKAFAEPFEKKFGIDIEVEIQTGTQDGLAKILAQKGNPQVDLVTTTEPAALVMRSQRASYKIPTEYIPNIKDLFPGERYLSEHWVGFYTMLNGIFYRSDMVPFEIKNWEDLWDVRLKNLITVPFVPFASGRFLVTLALINGGSERNIEPSFKAAERLKPNIAMLFKTDAESIKYVQSKEAAVCAYGLLPNVYKLIGKDSIYKFVIPPRFIMAGTNIMVITNPKKAALAAKFINFCISSEAQYQYCNLMGVLPTNVKAKLPEKIVDLKIAPIDPKDVYVADEKIVNENLKRWSERWDKEIAQK